MGRSLQHECVAGESRQTARLRTVLIPVEDFEEAVDFYVENFGCTIVRDIEMDDLRMVELLPGGQPGGATITLVPADFFNECPIRTNTGAAVLWVPNFVRLRRELVRDGVSVKQFAAQTPIGPLAVMTDPDGNELIVQGSEDGFGC